MLTIMFVNVLLYFLQILFNVCIDLSNAWKTNTCTVDDAFVRFIRNEIPSLSFFTYVVTNERTTVAALRFLFREAMFIRKFNKPDVKWRSFIQPFDIEIWFMILLTIILYDFLIESMFITTAKQANNDFRVTKNRKMFGSEIYCLIGIFCGQGEFT